MGFEKAHEVSAHNVEVTCAAKPWTIIPMVVTEVRDHVAAGQFRGGEQIA